MSSSDPQLYARVRQESEKKRKIAEAERAVLDGARRWFHSDISTFDLIDLIREWVELEDAK